MKAKAGHFHDPVSLAITTMVDVHWSAKTKKTISDRATGRLKTRSPVSGSTSRSSAPRSPSKSSGSPTA